MNHRNTFDRVLPHVLKARKHNKHMKAEQARLERINHNANILCNIEIDILFYNQAYLRRTA